MNLMYVCVTIYNIKTVIMNTNKFSNRLMKLAALAVIIMISAISNNVLAQKKKEKLLDDKGYIVTLTEEASKKPTKPIPDELSFKGNKLKSKAMDDKYKFNAGAFTATVDSTNIEEPVITFDAEMKGELDDVLTWHGTVTGEDIEGSAIWNKKGKTKKTYSFSGSIKKKK